MKERPYFDRVNSVFVLHRIEHDIQPDIGLIRRRGVSSSSGTWRCNYFSTGVEWDFVTAQNVSRILANEIMRLQ